MLTQGLLWFLILFIVSLKFNIKIPIVLSCSDVEWASFDIYGTCILFFSPYCSWKQYHFFKNPARRIFPRRKNKIISPLVRDFTLLNSRTNVFFCKNIKSPPARTDFWPQKSIDHDINLPWPKSILHNFFNGQACRVYYLCLHYI